MPPIACAALIVFFEGVALWAVFPTMSYYCKELGGDATAVGLMFALLAVPKVVTNTVFGSLADRIGRRPVLAMIGVGGILASSGWALAPNVWWLAASRFVAGVFGAQAALSQTIVADVTEPHRRAAGMGVLGAAFGLSVIVGPLVGGWSPSYAAVGWVCASVQSLSLLVILLFLRETRPAHPPAGEQIGPADNAPVSDASPPAAVPSAADRRVRSAVVLLLIVTFGLWFGSQEMLATFALLAEGRYGFNAHQTAWAFVVFGIVGIVVQGGIVRTATPRFGERALCAAGLVILAAGLVLFSLPTGVGLMWVAAGLVGAGVALATPTLTGLLSRSVGPRRQGRIMGVSQSVTALGRALGAFTGGALYGRLAPAAPYLSGAGVVLVAALLLGAARPRPKH